MEKKKYKIEGMFCAACANRVEKAAMSVAEVGEADVSLLTNSLTVKSDGKVNDEAICLAVKEAGYKASLDYGESVNEERAKRKKNLSKSLIKIIIGAVLSLIIMYFGMGMMLHLPTFMNVFEDAHFGMDIDVAIELVLTIAVIALFFPYYIHGFKALFKLHPSMESLVALGSGVSFIYSVVLYILRLTGQRDIVDFYFDSTAMILVLVSLGKYLESLAKSKTTSSLEALLALAPETATLKDGSEIPASSLKVGDICIVKAGSKVPADGKIVSGYGNLQESALTGEAVPVYKQEGDEVLGGSINMAGAFEMEVTRIGEESTLSKIAKMVEEAASSKGRLAKLADKVSGIFVPIVIGIALIVFLVWLLVSKDISLSIGFGVSCLVVACPCALGLATPVAVMVGAGRGAENGILIKSASSFETLAQTNALVFDKTGTLTSSHLVVLAYKPLVESKETTDALYSLENGSEHPLAWSIALFLEKEGGSKQEVSSFENIPGYGITGVVNGKKYAIGNKDLMDREKVEIFDENHLSYLNDGAAINFFSIDGKYAGFFASSDEPKEGAKENIASLKERGINVYLASGDSKERALHLAKDAGIEESNVFYGIKPEGKDEIIKKLQDEGKIVAMVGDGVNDAPALMRANVGIAIGSGTDLAIDSADMILMHGGLDELSKAFNLARKVTSNIKMNLFWAFIYNVIGIPLAAGAFYYVGSGFSLSPMWASLMMALSSVCVILNALRLKIVKI